MKSERQRKSIILLCKKVSRDKKKSEAKYKNSGNRVIPVVKIDILDNQLHWFIWDEIALLSWILLTSSDH